MFEHPNLITILLSLLVLCALIYLIKEIYYFNLDLNQKEAEAADYKEGQDTAHSSPSPDEWRNAHHALIRKNIYYELRQGENTFIPSLPERLNQQVFINVLNEMREKGYSVAVKTGEDGYIRSVTFDVSEAQNPSESKEVGSDVLGYDAFVFENVFTPSDSDTYVVSVPKGITSSSELRDTLYLMLKMPEYAGLNYDALRSCLGDLRWIKQRTVVLRHSDLPALPDSELQVYLDVLSEAVTGWGGVGHSLVVSFPYDVREELELRFPRK